MATFATHNPITGEVCGEYPIADAHDVACQVEQARKAAAVWAAQSVVERGAALARLRLLIAGNADALANTVANEIGKPLQEAYGADVLASLDALNWLVKQMPRLLREKPLPGAKGARQTPLPYGMVSVIGTWNYPLYLNLTPIAWALAAGNVVVWKPSELAPASALALMSLFERANLPVFLLSGDGTTGRELCRAGSDKLVFTGGGATGRAILKELAATNTPSVMELSGNDAMLVCDDADVALAARSAVWARVSNAGQSCVAPQRIYVTRANYDSFLTACQKEIATLRAGLDYGPLRTHTLRDNVHRLVWEAVQDGSRLLAGGHCLKERAGYFYAPTLLADCRQEQRVIRQDFFGPVLAVCPVRDEAEAVRFANDDDMALGASVWSKNRANAQNVAHQLTAPMISVNELLLDGARPELPFGGARGSGWGRQRGAAGLEEFVQWRVIASHRSGGARRHLFPYRAQTIPLLRALIAFKAAQGLGAKIQAARLLGDAARHWNKPDNNSESNVSTENERT